MIAKLKVTEENRVGKFFGIMVGDEWYLCDTLKEVRDVLWANNVGIRDIQSNVSTMSLHTIRKYDEGRLRELLEEKQILSNKANR